MENLHIRHRNVLRHHYTRTSNVLLFGYRGVSDGAKMTYQVIDAFDWANADGLRKGFAHPTLAHLARIRATSTRTVRRHLEELEGTGLLTRQERPGRPSLLIIEDPSADQAEQYLKSFGPDPEGEPDGRGGDYDFSETPDKNVRPPRTKMSAPTTLEEIQKEERQKNVEQALVEQRRGESTGSTHISTTLQHRRMELQARRMASADHRADFLADELCRELGDQKSRAFYLSVARTVPAHVIYESLGQVKELRQEGRIRTSLGATFVERLRRHHAIPGPRLGTMPFRRAPALAF